MRWHRKDSRTCPWNPVPTLSWGVEVTIPPLPFLVTPSSSKTHPLPSIWPGPSVPVGCFLSSNTIIHDFVLQHCLLSHSTLNFRLWFKRTKQIFHAPLQVRPIYETQRNLRKLSTLSLSPYCSSFNLSIIIVSSGSVCASLAWPKCFLFILWQAFCAYLHHSIFQVYLTDAYLLSQ